MLHDVCDPFRKVAVLPYRYAVSPHDDGFRLTAGLQQTSWQDQQTPKILTAMLRGRHAVMALDGETCGGRKIQVRLTRYQPAGEAGMDVLASPA
jgi:hypothetical protein